MVDSPFIEVLAKQSASRLREMLEQYDEDLERIKFERAYVARALATKKNADTGNSQTTAKPSTRKGGSKARQRATDRREAVLRVMKTDREAIWIPSAVRNGLVDNGIETTTPAVRAVMKRMLETKDLVRPGDGEQGFKLADAETPAGESVNGAGNGTDALQPAGIRPEGGGT